MTINLHDDDTVTGDVKALIQQDSSLEPLFSVYPPEQIQRLLDNRDKLGKLAQQFSGQMHAVTKNVMVMQCKAHSCPFASVCVLNKEGLAPEGLSCPIELKLANEIELSIVQSLDIDTQDTIEMELLYDFLDAKMLDMRASGLIAKGSIVQDVRGISEGREFISSKDIAPEVKIKLDLKKLKFSILEEFMATRKAKKKYGMGSTSTYESIIKQAMDREE